MTNEEKQFLIEEYKANWDHCNFIEERRYKIFQYYSAFLGVAIISGLTLYNTSHNINYFIGIDIICLLTSCMSFICIKVLKHERRANERYRDRINAIRAVFLRNSTDNEILELIRPKPNQGYIETLPCPKRDLGVMDFFRQEQYSTAMLMLAFIASGLIFSFMGFFFFSTRLIMYIH